MGNFAVCVKINEKIVGHLKKGTSRKFAKDNKIGALSRLSNHLNDSQKRLILNSIVKSQFSYCPLVWMFCSRTSNNMINKVHGGH